MSASRSGFKRSGASRARTSLCQSCMLGSRDPAYGLDERLPGLELRGEHAAAVGRDLVEPAPPLAGLLDPGSLDPTSFLKPIQQRIQRIDVERQEPAGADVDQLAELVTMAGLRLQQGEDQQLGRTLLQFAVERARVDVCHRQIVCRQILAVKRPNYPA